MPQKSAAMFSYTVIYEESWPLKIGPRGCPETSVRNYHFSLSNDPEERSSPLLRGGSLKSRIQKFLFGTQAKVAKQASHPVQKYFPPKVQKNFFWQTVRYSKIKLNKLAEPFSTATLSVNFVRRRGRLNT